jgi:hypothetical protein
MGPYDDNQWLFGHHLAHGGHAVLDWRLAVKQNLPSMPINFEPKSCIRTSKMPMDFLLIHAIISASGHPKCQWISCSSMPSSLHQDIQNANGFTVINAIISWWV